MIGVAKIGNLRIYHPILQSLTKICVHLIFSTKYRQPLIDDAIKPELFAYLSGICQELECYPIRVGGHNDHVHIECMLSKKIALRNLLEETKKCSSKRIKTKGEQYLNFYWQRGYAAFSVKLSEMDVLARYIDNQEEHPI